MKHVIVAALIAMGLAHAAHAQTYGVTLRTQNGGLPVERLRVETGVAVGQVLFTNAYLTIDNQQPLQLREAGGLNYAALRAPAALAADYTLTLPTDDGAASQVLTTDGAGGLSWSTPATYSAGNQTSIGVGNTIDVVEGPGSGLDADLLDGNTSSFFLDTSATGQTKTGTLTIGLLASGTNLTLTGDPAAGVPMIYVNSTDASADTGVRISSAGSMRAEIDTLGQFVFSNNAGNPNAGRIGGVSFAAANGAVEFGTYPGVVRVRAWVTNPGSLLLEGGTVAPASTNGMIYYDSGLAKFRVYEAGAWTNMVSGGGGVTSLDVGNGTPLTGAVVLPSTAATTTAYIQRQTTAAQTGGFWISGTGRASADFRAPIFYDTDNTTYYVDPAANSDLAANLAGGITIDGNIVIDNGAGWHRSYNSTGWYNGTYGGGWYMTDATYIRSYGSKIVYVDNGAGETVSLADGAATGNAVYASSNSWHGVVGLSSFGSGTAGLWGNSTAGASTRIGVYGNATDGTGADVGVFGDCDDTVQDWAGYFDGDVYASGSYLDIAEMYSDVETIPPGALVSIVTSSEKAEAVRIGLSRMPYDAKLVGVRSTHPAIWMGPAENAPVYEEERRKLRAERSLLDERMAAAAGKAPAEEIAALRARLTKVVARENEIFQLSNPKSGGDAGSPVALAGRVPVLVTAAEGGPIRVGDPITSSSKPGYGMKAAKAGPIVGFAMSALEKGEGTVLVNVSRTHYAPSGADAQGQIDALKAQVEALKKDVAALKK